MKEVLDALGLEEKHVDWKDLKVPVVEAGLYNTLGRQLFELYRKYDISSEDQRAFENMSFVLMSFVWQRKQSRPFWRRFLIWKR